MVNDKKRETLMRKIQMYGFVAHECALYLDGHPNNRQALNKHSSAVQSMNEAIAEYEGLYGPLTANSAGGQSWNWVKGRWPWQNSDMTD